MLLARCWAISSGLPNHPIKLDIHSLHLPCSVTLSLNNFINKSSNRIGFPTSPRGLFRSNLFCSIQEGWSFLYLCLQPGGLHRAGQCPTEEAASSPSGKQGRDAGEQLRDAGEKRRMQPGVIYMGTSNNCCTTCFCQQSLRNSTSRPILCVCWKQRSLHLQHHQIHSIQTVSSSHILSTLNGLPFAVNP